MTKDAYKRIFKKVTFLKISGLLSRLAQKRTTGRKQIRRGIRQWFGVTANAVLNTRSAQFINHANYKIVDSKKY